MPNFAKNKKKIQIKKIFTQELNFDRLVYIAAICYDDLILAFPINVQLLREKRMCAKL